MWRKLNYEHNLLNSTVPFLPHRLLAVRYPLKKYQGRTSSGVAVLFTWVIAVALAAPQIEVSQTNIFVHNGRAYRECREVWPAAAPRAARAYTIVVLAVTYVVPLALLTLTYAWVACILWAHSLPGNANARRDKHHLRNKRKVIVLFKSIHYPILFIVGSNEQRRINGVPTDQSSHFI